MGLWIARVLLQRATNRHLELMGWAGAFFGVEFNGQQVFGR